MNIVYVDSIFFKYFIACSRRANYYCETLLTICKFENLDNKFNFNYDQHKNPIDCEKITRDNELQKFLREIFFKITEIDVENQESNNKLDFNLQVKYFYIYLTNS
jgi:hypothetical protein